MATRRYACIKNKGSLLESRCDGIVEWTIDMSWEEWRKKKTCPTCGQLPLDERGPRGWFECKKCKAIYSHYSPMYDTEEVPCSGLKEV